jgi:large subunit ribosomal protein L15
LADLGLVRAGSAPLKVLGNGEISRAMKVTANKFSGSAKAKIEKAGGQAVIV